MCKYCKNKFKNKYIVNTDDYNAGVDARIEKYGGTAFIAVSGWYDGWSGGAVGIGVQRAPISYCPMCGRDLRVVSE